jgi:hypothetical protein
MSRTLSSCRIGNFGFSSGGLSQPYLRSVERLVDSRGEKRSIVLGVTPWSLTPRAERENQFLDEVKRPAAEVWERLYIGPATRFFRPYSLAEVAAWLQGRRIEISTAHYYQDFRTDGWVASRKAPEDEESALGEYVANFKGNPVSPKIIDDLLVTVQGWRAKGVRVFAFRLPTTSAMRELEKNLSGFDEESFVARFEKAGGIWLPIRPTAYHSYDGSHLDESAALDLSRDLAVAMAPHL